MNYFLNNFQYFSAMNITDLQFSGEGSYASLASTRSLRRESHITLSFKPDYPNGILFLALPVRNSGDFMALVLVNGTLQFTFYLGEYYNKNLMG